MKYLMILLASLLTSNAFATTDALTFVHLVTHNYNTDEFDVVAYQYSGCYGINEGPQSAAFTEPFLVEAPRGCGGVSGGNKEDVNALSCADGKYEWSEDFDGVKKVNLDISKCPKEFKDSQEFRIMVRKAAQKNFPAAWDITIKD